MSAQLSNDTRSLAEIYSDISKNVQYPMAVDLLKKMDAKSITTGLDVGCGTGDAVIYLAELLADAKKEYTVHGIDPLPDRIDVAKENLAKVNKQRKADGKVEVKVDFQLGGAEDVEKMYGHDSMDIIFFNAVIHWVKDIPDALRQCQAVLKKGGRVGFTTPSGAHDFGMDIPKQLCSEPPYNKYQYEPLVKLMTLEQASKLIKGADFRETFCDAISWPLPFRNYEEFALHMSSSSYGNFGKFPHLPDDLADQAREEMTKRLIKAYTKDSAFEIPLYQIFAIGLKD